MMRVIVIVLGLLFTAIASAETCDNAHLRGSHIGADWWKK